MYFQDYPTIRTDHERANYTEVSTPQKHTNFITDYTLFLALFCMPVENLKNKLWVLKKENKKKRSFIVIILCFIG